MIKYVQVRNRRKGKTERYLLCLKLLREPMDDDLKTHKLYSSAVEVEQSNEVQMEVDDEGDSLMQDLERDLIDKEGSEEADGSNEVIRIPPQWTPERLLSNTIFEVVKLTEANGGDSNLLRERTTGIFWKRPLESYVSRLTDDWEKAQPYHLRHLSIVRDNEQTDAKKALRYVYRTYENYNKAITAGQVFALKSLDIPTDAFLDEWGFRPLSVDDFHGRTGSSTLAKSRPQVTRTSGSNRKWDNTMKIKIGYRSRTSRIPALGPQNRTLPPSVLAQVQNEKAKKGRKKAEVKRVQTESGAENGEATVVVDSDANDTLPSLPRNVQPRRQNGYIPLLTEQERIDLELPPRGRLGVKIENAIRKARGLPAKPTNGKGPRKRFQSNEKALLNQDQREAAGYCRMGRLPQALIEQLRRRRALGTPLTKGLLEELKRRRANGLSLTSPPLFDFDCDGEVLPDEDEGVNNRAKVGQAGSAKLPSPTPIVEPSANITPGAITGRPSSERSAEGNNTNSPRLAKRVQLSSEAHDEAVPQEDGVSHAEGAPHEGSVPHVADLPGQEVIEPVTTSPDASLVPAKRKLNRSAIDTSKPRKKSRASPGVPSSTRPWRKRRAVGAAETNPTGTIDDFEASSPDAVPDQLLTEAEMQKEDIMAKYADRVAPGLYYNPFATRKTGRGRPPKVFLATFRLPSLHEFTWFTQAPAAAIALPPIRLPALADRALESEHTVAANSQGLGSAFRDVGAAQPDASDAQADVVDADVNMVDIEINMRAKTPIADASAVQPTGISENSTRSPIPNERSVETKQSPDIHAEKLTPPETILDTVETPPKDRSPTPAVKSHENTEISQGDVGPQKPCSDAQPNAEIVQELVSSTTLDRNQYSSQSRLPPAGWKAINLSATDQSVSYHSPYGTPTPTRPSPPALATNELGAMTIGGTAEVSATPENTATVEQRFSSVGLVNRNDSPRSRQREKKATRAAGVRLAAGSVQNARASIIKHIIDLCNGVFPGNGEISVVLEGIWKERAPKKMPCPDRSTINITLRKMLEDPSYNLRQTEILVQSIEVEAPAKKHFLSYRNIPLQSPEVHRVILGIKQRYPYRYFPPEVQQYVNKSEPKPIAPVVFEIDESVQVDDIFPARARRINNRIKELARMRKEDARQKKQKKAEEAEERQISSKEAEKAQLAKGLLFDGTAPGKRVRLVGLNQTSQPKRQQLPHQVTHDKNHDGPGLREHSPTLSESSEDIPLWLLRPKAGLARTGVVHDGIVISSDAESSSYDDDEDNDCRDSTEEVLQETTATEPVLTHELNRSAATLMAPGTYFYRSNGTFSTEFHLSKEEGDATAVIAAKVAAVFQKNGRKRVRVADPAIEGPSMKARRTGRKSTTTADGLYVNTCDDSEEDKVQSKQKRKSKNRRTTDLPNPTLVERLTGLTGNPNDPDYQPPSKKQVTFKTWAERKAKGGKAREMPVTKYLESLDPVDVFKKLSCALVVASSMSGHEGAVDWSIIAKIYDEEPSFNLEKIKKTWSWMRKHMATQLHELTETFQLSFLEAYEKGTLASIEDPETYDWANLVRWALKTCKYPEPLLPIARKALDDYEVDVSPFEVIDRSLWYKENLSVINRTQRLLKYAYVAPLHQSEKPTTAIERQELKARSWIRANISTPKSLYDKKKAHDKLSPLGDSIIGRVVSDFVRASLLRLWKLKRLRPGRNYDFTRAFAKNYRRPHELKEFIAAAKFKKDLDAAFMEENIEKRAFAISRTAGDGVYMAVMSLVDAGQVKLVPRLPPVNNDFKAPLPRLSIWGLNEGDYRARRLDRQRLFWEVDVVPTPTYQFGNPLQPTPLPLTLKDDGSPADWPALPKPPLPGRHNPDALLPIWSSIDGESVTWPWWNRVLNLVLQPLMFQPGITAAEIFRHCPKHTTEIFEIELVLGWLGSVKALHRSDYGAHDLLPGFWAVFGDRLIDEEEDAFGEHVKRKNTAKKGPGWRSEYNLRYSTLHQTMVTGIDGDTSEEEEEELGDAHESGTPAAQDQIMRRPRKQYDITKKALKDPGSRRARKAAARKSQAQSQQASSEQQASSGSSIDPALLSITQTPPPQDVEMMDAYGDAEGDDVDAEGELDDTFAMETSTSTGN